MDFEERYSRQKQIVSAERIEFINPLVIGVGAIGRNVAVQLASIGVKQMTLVDFDYVEESNIASQGYWEQDLSETDPVAKVDATAKVCSLINSSIKIKKVCDKYKRSIQSNVVFLCVDSISTREFIWEAAKDRAEFFIDGRMSAEVFRILTVDDPISKAHYPTTFFSEAEAFVGSCTAKSTIYCSNIAAGFMVQAFTKWLRGFPNDADVSFNLLSNDLIINDLM